jgi:hypothetical protein
MHMAIGLWWARVRPKPIACVFIGEWEIGGSIFTAHNIDSEGGLQCGRRSLSCRIIIRFIIIFSDCSIPSIVTGHQNVNSGRGAVCPLLATSTSIPSISRNRRTCQPVSSLSLQTCNILEIDERVY